MKKKPNFEELEHTFSKGEEFSLTEAQYKAKTGAPMPQKKSYLLNNSALAKRAKKFGYRLELIEKTIIFKKKKED